MHQQLAVPLPRTRNPGISPPRLAGSFDLQPLGESIDTQHVYPSFSSQSFAALLPMTNSLYHGEHPFREFSRVDHRPRRPRQHARPSFSTAPATILSHPVLNTTLASVTLLGHHLLSGGGERFRRAGLYHVSLATRSRAST